MSPWGMTDHVCDFVSFASPPKPTVLGFVVEQAFPRVFVPPSPVETSSHPVPRQVIVRATFRPGLR